VFKRVEGAFAAAALMAVVVAIPNVGSACETIHLKRLKNVPPPQGGSQGLCWTGCPFKFEGELDSGKGRWIFKKQSGDNKIEGVWTVEKNLVTGEVFYMATERSDRQCPVHPAVAAAQAAGAVNMMMMFCPNSVGDYLVKFVSPKVCIDQTLNCPANQQKAAVVLHDWDDVDDLGRGIPVTLNIPPVGPTVFTHGKGDDFSVWWEFCCGKVADYGSAGDNFSLDTYYTLRTPGGQCINETMRKGARSSGDPLPDPNVIDTECNEKP